MVWLQLKHKLSPGCLTDIKPSGPDRHSISFVSLLIAAMSHESVMASSCYGNRLVMATSLTTKLINPTMVTSRDSCHNKVTFCSNKK